MTTHDETSPAEALESSRTWQWQVRLLPFVTVAISLMAIFFFVSSLALLNRLNTAVALRGGTEVSSALQDVRRHAAALGPAEAVDMLKWRVQATLEAEVMQNRYRQVNSTLQLRAWTRHMGFMTGMIMAFVGAIFILSRLKEQETRLNGEYQGIKAGLATSSPGIVLATLGTVLMFVTLLVDYRFETRDVPVYLAIPATLAAPEPMPKAGSDAADNQLFPPREGIENATSNTGAPAG